MTKIYLVRHGETDWNLAGKLQGQEDIPLNKTGLAQAVQCGEALSRLDITAVYSSHLSRAAETAKEIARHHNCCVTLDPALAERNYGRLSGMTLAQREQLQANGLPDEVEAWEALASRAMSALERYAQILGEEDRAVLVSHGGWINSVLAVLSDHAIGTGKTRLNNTCISVLARDGGSWRILRPNLSPEEFVRWEEG